MNSSQFSYDALVLAKSIRDNEYKGMITRSQALQRAIDRKLITFINGMWKINPHHTVQKYRWINGKMVITIGNKSVVQKFTFTDGKMKVSLS